MLSVHFSHLQNMDNENKYLALNIKWVIHLEHLEDFVVQSKCYLRISCFPRSFFFNGCHYPSSYPDAPHRVMVQVHLGMDSVSPPLESDLVLPPGLGGRSDGVTVLYISLKRVCFHTPRPFFHQRNSLSVACERLGSTWTRTTSAQTEALEIPDKVNTVAHRCMRQPSKACSIHSCQVFGLCFQGNPPEEFSQDTRIHGGEKETECHAEIPWCLLYKLHPAEESFEIVFLDSFPITQNYWSLNIRV